MSSITKAYSEVLFKVLLKCTIYNVYESLNMSNCVYKDDCEIEVLARSPKNGANGQNALYSF